MKAWRHVWPVAAACAALAALVAAGQDVSAQCSLCRSALAGSPEAAKLSSRLNLAVVVLLIPPVLIFVGIFYAAFRGRRGAKTRRDPPRLTPHNERPKAQRAESIS